MSEFSIILWINSIIFTAISLFCFRKSNTLNKNLAEEFQAAPHFAPPNDDGYGISLTTFNGFGKCFQGKFRISNIGDKRSYVTYHCLMLLFVVFPGTPYRVIETTGKWDMNRSFHIIGSEIEDKREKYSVRCRFYGMWSMGVAIFSFLMALMFF